MTQKELAKLKKGVCVRIHWVDVIAGNDQGWVEGDEVKAEPAECMSAGFVVKRDKHQVVIAMSRGKNDKEVNTIGQIPLGCITKVEVFE